VERFFEGRVTAQQEADSDRVGVNRMEDPAHGPSQHDGIEATLGT
jgi:hypothetical protein